MKVLKRNDIHFQNDFEDEIVEEPSNIAFYYDDQNTRYSALFRTGMYALKGYKIFDYLLLNTSLNNSISYFEIDLVNNEMYDKYVENVLSRDDEFLKAYMLVYLKGEDIEQVFGSKKNIADVFINEKKYNIDYKLNGLMGLCDYKLDKDLIIYIKENIAKMINNIQISDGVGGVITDEEKQNLINQYLDTIDQYQKDYETNVLY